MSKKFGKKFLGIKNLKVKNKKKKKIFERGRYWGLYIVIGVGVCFVWGVSGCPGVPDHSTHTKLYFISIKCNKTPLFRCFPGVPGVLTHNILASVYTICNLTNKVAQKTVFLLRLFHPVCQNLAALQVFGVLK